MFRDKISLIITAYNSDYSIAQCLDSAIAQDYDNYEIILVNDGSTDNTHTVCTEYAQAYGQIHYFKTNNGGPSSARNYAISQSSGAYIAFADSDDIFAPQYLSFMYHLMQQNDADIVITDTLRGYRATSFAPYFSEDSKVYDWQSILSMKLHTYFPQHQVFGKLFKRKIVERVKFPVGHAIEDYYVFPKYCFYAGHVIYNHSKIYLYCIDNNDSIMRSAKNESFLKDQLLAHNEWVSFLDNKDTQLKNLAIKKYLEKLFSAYGLIENGMINGNKTELLKYVKDELERVYIIFFKEITSLEGISFARFWFLIRPKYFLMKHCLFLAKHRYKKFYHPSNKHIAGKSQNEIKQN